MKKAIGILLMLAGFFLAVIYGAWKVIVTCILVFELLSTGSIASALLATLWAYLAAVGMFVAGILIILAGAVILCDSDSRYSITVKRK